MALYHFKHGDTEGLIEAASAAQALREVAKDIVTIKCVTSAVEASRMVKRGLEIRTIAKDAGAK